MAKQTTTPIQEKAPEQEGVKDIPVEKTPKAAVTQTPKAEEQATTQSTTVLPAVKKESEPIKNFTAYLLPEEAYSQEAALEKLRQKLRSYKEIHAGFLAKTEEEDAFVVTKEYVPVYRQKATVDYFWTVNNKEVKTEHSERREVSCSQYTAPKFFAADRLPDGQMEKLPAAKGKEELFPCKQKKFSAGVKALQKEAKAYSPQRGAKIQLSECAYEVVYVPVLKAVCTYEDKEYVGYVNLVGGECEAQYRVSDRLLKKADKAMANVRFARRLILFSLIYALSFVGVGWYFAYKTETMAKLLILLIGMTCALVVPASSYGACFGYKREKFILRAVQMGKMPKVILARVLACVCVLLAAAEMLAFVLYAI